MKYVILSFILTAGFAVQARAECEVHTREDFKSKIHRLVCDDADFGGFDTVAQAQSAADYRNCQGSLVSDIGCRAGDEQGQPTHDNNE